MPEPQRAPISTKYVRKLLITLVLPVECVSQRSSHLPSVFLAEGQNGALFDSTEKRPDPAPRYIWAKLYPEGYGL